MTFSQEEAEIFLGYVPDPRTGRRFPDHSRTALLSDMNERQRAQALVLVLSAHPRIPEEG